MCIVLLTTAHPSYALIVIDNRDEFILRPTSRPHWWTPSHTPSPSAQNGTNGTHTSARSQEILSSRDLQRAERGTWLGITRSGNLAVLTNYKEDNFHDGTNPMHQLRSRGAMVTAWLGAERAVGAREFVEGMVRDGSTRGVGGFSLICGKLRPRELAEKNGNVIAAGDGEGEWHRKTLEPFAIVSNRSHHPEQIPWVAGERDQVWGLSNIVYDQEPAWPKVQKGKKLLKNLAVRAHEQRYNEAALVQGLFEILDDDTLPLEDKLPFEESLARLNESIFIPALGDADHKKAMEQAKQKVSSERWQSAREKLKGVERPEADATAQQGFTTGMYGTQRQTVILVDWDGDVTFVERALWDANGNAVKRGEGDVTFRFKVEGWDEVQESAAS
jgi:uncharacterized protein with NRDE domain